MLLVGGPSGTGKSAAAAQLGRQLGISSLQVDDIRLALQYSRVTLPAESGTAALYFFLNTPDVWQLPPARLVDGLIAVGEVLSPAIEIVITHHVDTQSPVIIEGDGILSSLLARPAVRDYVKNGLVKAVFLTEPDEAAIHLGTTTRARGTAETTDAELAAQVRAAWLYGQWLAHEAERYGAPLVEARPWATLPQRILTAIK
ncbi:MAG TPA: isopentenyl transferase family protein [Chloroflexia bacterium]|nr:isopentenyl transferase family protein [Chloroflexia bacterium]